jgi:hypothetical protein
MEPHHSLREWIAWLGARRWRKEILLAIVLTIAAAVFLTSALMGGDGDGDGPLKVQVHEPDAPVSTAHKPAR